MSTTERLLDLSKILDERYMTYRKACLIYDCMKSMADPPRNILEVGTFAGTGAVMLATMVAPWGGHVTSVDLPWVGKPNEHFSKVADDWIKELGIKNVTLVRRDDGAEGWLLDRFRAKAPPLDFCYIDGGHRWVNTIAQFASCYAALRPGGWLCFDDLLTATWQEVDDTWRNVVCRLVPESHRYEVDRYGFCRR